jgi:hypothetical protein
MPPLRAFPEAKSPLAESHCDRMATQPTVNSKQFERSPIAQNGALQTTLDV